MTVNSKQSVAPFGWDHPTMLAPMEGVSHPEFRRIFAERGGIGVVCTEFVRISRAPLHLESLAKHVVKAPGTPLSVQVMGNDAAKMADAAASVAHAGADVVDINLGCPAPRAVRKGVGAAMLKDPELLFSVLSSMRQRVSCLLSAKIRAGFEDADHVVHIGRTVEKAGADFLVVHPRRRADFYEGVADWRIIRTLKDALGIPVVGNGDCWYGADALRMREETGCDAVMIGRPALRNPWIFMQIAQAAAGAEPFLPVGADVASFIESMACSYRQAFPRRRDGAVGKLKELITYIGRAVDDAGQWRRSTLRLESPEAIVGHAWEQLGDMGSERLDLDFDGHLGLEQSGSALHGPSLSAELPTGPWRGAGGQAHVKSISGT